MNRAIIAGIAVAGLAVALYALTAQAAVGASADSFYVDCTTTPTAITPESGKTMLGYECQTPASGETAGTVLVAVGDSTVTDPAYATRSSEVFSGDTIRSFSGPFKGGTEYCRADTGTVRIFCRAAVSN